MTSKSQVYHLLDPAHTNPKRLKKEREKARALRKSHWWKNQIALGVCHYCSKKISPALLTMDHLVPLARGGTSSKGNVVPACKSCNENKKLKIPVEDAFEELERQKKDRSTPENEES